MFTFNPSTTHFPPDFHCTSSSSMSCGPPHCGGSRTHLPRVMRALSLRMEPDTPPTCHAGPLTAEGGKHTFHVSCGPPHCGGSRTHLTCVMRAPSLRREPDTPCRVLWAHSRRREPDTLPRTSSSLLPPALSWTVSQCNKRTLRD